jgi:hypothetical protein
LDGKDVNLNDNSAKNKAARPEKQMPAAKSKPKPAQEKNAIKEVKKEGKPRFREILLTTSSVEIRTKLDDLFDLVEQQGSIAIPDAAERLGTKAAVIEKWAHLLEEGGLIEVAYPLVGQVVLKKK